MKAVVYDRLGAAPRCCGSSTSPALSRARRGARQGQLLGVNPTDWKSRSGATARLVDEFQIPHHDGSGVIDAVGPGVDEGRVGQRVWIWMAAAGSRWGTAAEWTVVSDQQAVALPQGRRWSWEPASACPR